MKRLIAVAGSLAIATLLVADIPHRAASPQEKAALEKALSAITKVIDQFGNADWTMVSGFHPKTESVSGEPSSPIDAALSYNRKYGIKDGSPLFKSKIRPAVEAIHKAMDAKDYAAVTKASETTNGTMDFTVETFVNQLNVPTGANAANLAARGAAIAYEMKDPKHVGEYIVIVGAGDWAHAKGTASRIDFRFRNGKNTPHVENIVFEFRTRKDAGFAADRIREIVRTTDWSALDKGLTP